jgi:acyl-CoA dehydrogenase
MDYLDIDLDLTDDDLALKEAVHKFAKEVIRPVAKELDAMSAEDYVADDSPYHDYMKQLYQLGYHKIFLPESVGGMGLSSKQQCIVVEELGWGSFGLTIQLVVGSFVALGPILVNNNELIEEFTKPYVECKDGSIRACWLGTEPDHGTDVIPTPEPWYRSPEMKANCRARKEGDEWVINGQKASWITGGTLASHAWGHIQADPSQGYAGCICAIIPLDLPGVTRGKPLEKLGQRDLNQGELFFDDVRIPSKYVVVQPEMYPQTFEGFLTTANLYMSMCATGLARAAYEEAFAYSQERVVGLKPLKDHFYTKIRMFEMFRRVEVCRAITRRATELNFNITPGFMEYSIVAKTTSTQLCLENANDAIQLLGGNGIAKEYLPEKLYRDARMSLIEDGLNEMLAADGGHKIYETYPRQRPDAL